MPNNSSKRGTRLLGPSSGRLDAFDRIEHKNLKINGGDNNSKLDNISGVENILNGLSERPIMLFPVRLETKYVGTGVTEKLRIRIFPDEVVIKSHERPLTDEELQCGMDFWNEFYQANKDETAEKEAWEKLVKKFGVERAAWIRSQLKPTNYPVESIDNSNPFINEIAEKATSLENFSSRPLDNEIVRLAAAKKVLTLTIHDISYLKSHFSSDLIDSDQVPSLIKATTDLIAAFTSYDINQLSLLETSIDKKDLEGIHESKRIAKDELESFSRLITLAVIKKNSSNPLRTVTDLLYNESDRLNSIRVTISRPDQELLLIQRKIDSEASRLKSSNVDVTDITAYLTGVNLVYRSVKRIYNTHSEVPTKTISAAQKSLNTAYSNFKNTLENLKDKSKLFQLTNMPNTSSEVMSAINQISDLYIPAKTIPDYSDSKSLEAYLSGIQTKIDGVTALLRKGNSTAESFYHAVILTSNWHQSYYDLYYEELNPLKNVNDPKGGVHSPGAQKKHISLIKAITNLNGRLISLGVRQISFKRLFLLNP